MAAVIGLATDPQPEAMSVSAARQRRLLVVVRGQESYGTETKMFGVLESLVSRGACVRLYALGEGSLVALARTLPGLPITVGPDAPPRFEAGRSSRLAAYARTLRASATFMRHLARFLDRHPADAMLFCEHGLALQIGMVARRAETLAFWLMANGVSAGYPLDLNRRVYAFAFRHLAVAPVANSEHTRGTLGRGARHAGKIDLGINPDRLVDGAPTPSGSGDAMIRLLVMSRLVEGKGHLVLLRALLSRPEFSAIHLTICGGPLGTPYAETLMREAAAHGAAHRLELLGAVQDAGRHYRRADVVANARLDPEPFGLSVVEAMLLAKPVLAHAAGGPAETVVDGVTGWHVDAPDTAGFAVGLARMLADRARWPEMGRAGADRARQRYTHHSMTDQLLAVIGARLGDA